MKEQPHTNRRSFLKGVAALGAAAAVAPGFLQASPSQLGAVEGGEGYTFLFQGDSITDGNRGRNNDWNHVMGHGYQFIIASKWWYEYPGKGFHFFNRGISGNTVPDLAARWQTDTLDLKPDLLSVLIGINDTLAMVKGDKSFTVDAYAQRYDALLRQTKQRLPQVQLVLCEPFVLPVGWVKDKWEVYQQAVQQQQAVVKRLATTYDAVHVPFQRAFDQALGKAPADYWIWDGIHPMPAGHELMAREWMQQVSQRLAFLRPQENGASGR